MNDFLNSRRLIQNKGTKNSKYGVRLKLKKINEIEVCKAYAYGYNGRIIADTAGVNKNRIYRILQKERSRFSEKRIRFWAKQKISTVGISALFNIKSRKTDILINKIVEEVKKNEDCDVVD